MYKLDKRERELREKLRGRYCPHPAWYAAMTHAGKERRICDQISFDLRGNGVGEVFLPEIISHNGKHDSRPPELLFSSYVFFQTIMTDAIYEKISSYDGVFQILGRAYRIPMHIEDSEIAHLKAVLVHEPRPRMAGVMNIGAPVVVTEGLMRGMRGRIIEAASRRVKIETHFSFLDPTAAVVIVVPWEMVELDDSPPPLPPPETIAPAVTH
ncbi:MAG: hypothetical protein N3D11_16760 [Candidatus Sumerlaeia bacterium]|nr:hypothetical protein [Candidatus Sumerlaeia bacterium]